MFRWRQLREQGVVTGLKANEPLFAASEMKAARAKIRELQRLLALTREERKRLCRLRRQHPPPRRSRQRKAKKQT